MVTAETMATWEGLFPVVRDWLLARATVAGGCGFGMEVGGGGGREGSLVPLMVLVTLVLAAVGGGCGLGKGNCLVGGVLTAVSSLTTPLADTSNLICCVRSFARTE